MFRIYSLDRCDYQQKCGKASRERIDGICCCGELFHLFLTVTTTKANVLCLASSNEVLFALLANLFCA